MARWPVLAVALAAFGIGCQRASSAGDGSVWVVEAPGKGKLFICGTIHLLRKSDYPLPATYDAAYAASDELILELPPGAGGSPELGRKMRELGTLPDGSRLEEVIPEELWERVRDWAGARGLGGGLMTSMRPWFAALTMVSVEYAALGANPALGVDQVFEERAKKDGKTARGLETEEFQLNLFAGLDEELQVELLAQTLDEIETTRQEFERMVASWREGRLDDLHEMLTESMESHPDLLERFLTARNLAWAKVLDERLQLGGTVMVLVGAAHLGGGEGLLELLRQRGCKVERLTSGGE
jgi:uncharacterized protein YbaP (TraB family)